MTIFNSCFSGDIHWRFIRDYAHRHPGRGELLFLAYPTQLLGNRNARRLDLEMMSGERLLITSSLPCSFFSVTHRCIQQFLHGSVKLSEKHLVPTTRFELIQSIFLIVGWEP